MEERGSWQEEVRGIGRGGGRGVVDDEGREGEGEGRWNDEERRERGNRVQGWGGRKGMDEREWRRMSGVREEGGENERSERGA